MTRILRYIILSAALICTLAGCSDDETNSEQMAEITKYLTTKHSPALISEAEVGESIVAEPEFYTNYAGGAFRYIRDYYAPEREQRQMVVAGDKVTITLWCYFLNNFTSSSNTSPEGLYYTNDSTLSGALAEAGLNITHWPLKPLVITQGQRETIKGLDIALEGCRVDDIIEVYLSYEMCYDKRAIGLVDLKEGAVVICRIDNIID